MAHLYFKMKETTAAQQPLDVRILKYLLVKAHTPLAFLLTTLHGALGRPPSRLHSQERSPYRGLHFHRENVCVCPSFKGRFLTPRVPNPIHSPIHSHQMHHWTRERKRERERVCVNRSRLLSCLLCTLAGRRLLCACGTFKLSFELSEHLRRLS